MQTTQEIVEALAQEDAAEAIRIAKDSVEPVAWITGNSFMPPLRDFGHAEHVWQNDVDGTDWVDYVEAFERTLDEANVYLDCPDYDNALYVVDLSRWEYVDPDGEFYDDEAPNDSLQDEWRPI